MSSPNITHESAHRGAPVAPARIAQRRLADFTADPRILILVAMAICIGSLSAGAAWLLVKLIALVTNLVWFGRLTTDGSMTMAQAARGPWMVVAPALGGLVIGLMARFGTSKIRGHGIPEAIETILIGNSRIGPKVAILKPISSAISIGTGGPFGAEGPIIMTGGAIGSLFAQFFALSAAERKTLLVAGAAAGMTAIFGTPIAAVLLAVELLLFEWKPRSFIPVSVAALVAIAWRPLLFGAAPLFPFAGAELPWWGFVAAGGLGVLAGLLSGTLTILLYKAEDAFERLPIHWMWWPALGGLFVGLGGLIEPRALGVGYDVISDLLNDRMALTAVLLVLVVKSAIWLVSLSSGTSGGVLAPLLIIGGALGWVVGLALPGNPGFWALVGMTAMLGGTMRAPLTGAIFAVELTGSLHGLASLLTGTVAAYAVTVLLLKRSILTEKIARRGQHITREYATDPYELTRAAEIMVRDVVTVPATMTIAAAIDLFQSPDNRHLGYPIVDETKRLVGIVTRADALSWQVEGDNPDETLGERSSDAATPIAHPQDVAGYVVDLMISEDVGLVPIVVPETRELVGIITRKDLLAIRRATGTLERERARFYAKRRVRVATAEAASPPGSNS